MPQLPLTAQNVADSTNLAPIGVKAADSVHEYLERTAGEKISKTLACVSTGTVVNNVFAVTGACKILKLYGVVNTALANATNVHFALYDGTATLPLTKTTTATLSALGVGTTFQKVAALATALNICDSAAGCVYENAGTDLFFPCVVQKKINVATYIQFIYTTSTNPLAGNVTIYIEYRPDTADGAIVAV